MMSYRWNIQLPWVTQKRFIGNWQFRLEPLLECGLDFNGKTVLDAGCNIGIIAYELSKRGAASIHGIDHYRSGIYAARNIFAGVDIPSRFDILDMTRDRKLRRSLKPGYDIVLFMSVWQHVRKEYGDRVANRLTATLAERCNGVFVGQTIEDQAAAFSAVMKTLGFAPLFDRDPQGRLFTFQRV